MTTFNEVKMLDIHGPIGVQIEVQRRGPNELVLYIHVDGITVLRVAGIYPDVLELQDEDTGWLRKIAGIPEND
jgi:hypothetical protein